MAAAADSPGERHRPGESRDRRQADRVGGQRLLVGGDPPDDQGTIDLTAARPADGRGATGRRGRAHGATGEPDDRADLWSAERSPARRAPAQERGRWSALVTLVGLVTVAGLLAALVGGLAAGARGATLAGGAGGGAAVGLLVGLLCVRLSRPATGGSAGTGSGGGAASGAAHGASADTGPGTGGTGQSNLAPLLTSIGHRFQTLADRQLVALTARSAPGAESGAGDDGPEHDDVVDDVAGATRLARRMRRLAKTLQVLADDPTSWEAAPPATMAEIVAAAVAELEQEVPLDSRSLQPASIEGEAVPDVAHLLAELIENAVAASASSASRVVIIGRRTADGYVVSVVDEGSGMPEAQRQRANAQLHAPPPLHRQTPTSLGLATAGRLAARHGIAVTLLEAPTDGLIAKVRVPVRLLGGAPPEPSGSARPRSRAVIDLTDDHEPSAPPTGPQRVGAGRSDRPGGSGDSTPGRTPGGGPRSAGAADTPARSAPNRMPDESPPGGPGAQSEERPEADAEHAAAPLSGGGTARRPSGASGSTAPAGAPGEGGPAVASGSGPSGGTAASVPAGAATEVPPAAGDLDEPLTSAAEARADLARRVQRSRPVPREVAVRREPRPADPAAPATASGPARRPQPDTARPTDASGEPGTDPRR